MLMRYLVLLSLLTSVIASSPYNVYVNGSSDNAASFDPAKHCGDIESPCVTFDGGLEAAALLKLSERKPITILVAEGYYVHNSSTIGYFQDVSDLSIIGEANDSSSVIVECDEGVGFRFIRCNNIKISLMTFQNCSQLQNSTSYNFQSDNRQFVQFKVGLYFLYCYNVNLTSITVGESAATGIVLYNVAGTNILDGLNIKGNIYRFDSSSGGGGVYIEYSYCVPSEGDSSGSDCLYSSEWNPNVDVFYIHDAKFYISNCHFVNNIANATHESFISAFILPHQQYHDALGRGGGLSVFVKGSASNNHIIVDSCVFKNNSALWGGGIFIEFQDTSNNNLLLVRSSELKNNEVYSTTKTYQQTGGGDTRQTGGGGTRIGYIFFDHISYSNNVTFSKSNFTSNKAYNGGGISLYSARYSNYTNTFQLKECYFELNHAMIGGSALDLSLWHSSLSGAHIKPVIKNCTFANHKNHKQIVVGTVYVDSLPVSFGGDTFFIDNDGSALAVTGSYINIERSSSVTFYRNRGRNGGAIALFGNTFILTNEDSHLTFINNTALYKGGAIYFYNFGEIELFSSGNCFVRYSDIFISPNNWTSKFYFEGNMIGSLKQIHNSIYASSLLPCYWGGTSGVSFITNLTEIYCQDQNWKYFTTPGVKSNCNEQISTSSSRIRLFKRHYNVPPGNKPIKLDMETYSNFNITVKEESLLIGSLIEYNESVNFSANDESSYDYISHGQLRLTGIPDSKVQVRLETLGPSVDQEIITVYFNSCPAVFEYNASSHTCECPDGSFGGYVTCDKSKSTIKIRTGSWIGKVEDIDEYLVGLSPYVIKHASKQVSIKLPKHPDDLSNYLCNETNRNGTLCGECKEGCGVAINSGKFACVECEEEYSYYYWLFYLLAEFLPVTIFFAIVFIFSMKITSGPLNSFIFFAQVITTVVDIDANGMIPLDEIGTNDSFFNNIEAIYFVPYDIWNLNFFQSILPDFCLSRYLTTIDVQCLGYITPFYTLILLIVFLLIWYLYDRGTRFIVCIVRPFRNCIARLRQWTNFQQSATAGIAVFFLVCYTKIAFISLKILAPVPLYFSNGSVATYVFHSYGEFEWGSQGLSYIIVAILMICIFVLLPPLLLLYPSFLRLIEWLSCWKLQLGRLYPPFKLQALLNEFHGCYKDGSDNKLDCRWFASLYFFMRIALFIIYALSNTSWYYRYTLQLLFMVFMAFLFALFQPYRKAWINQVDIAIFLNLAAIIALSQYNLETIWMGKSPLTSWAPSLQYILILLPLLYCAGYCIVYIVKRIKDKWMPYFARRRYLKTLDVQNEFEADHKDALVDSTHVPDFLNFVESTNRFGSKKVELMDSLLWKGDVNGDNKSDKPAICDSIKSASDDENTPLLHNMPQQVNYNTDKSTSTTNGINLTQASDYSGFDEDSLIYTANSVCSDTDDQPGAVGTTVVYLS